MKKRNNILVASAVAIMLAPAALSACHNKQWMPVLWNCRHYNASL